MNSVKLRSISVLKI